MQPLKVMCVNVPDDWHWMKTMFGFDHPVVGDECEVEKVSPCSCGKHDQYQLAGYPYSLFADHHFAALPGMTSDEMEELKYFQAL